MKDFIAKYYNKMKDVLQREISTEIDIEELTFEVDEIIERFYDEIEKNTNFATNEYEFEGADAVKGLFTKFERLKGVLTNSDNRNTESGLAEWIDIERGTVYQTPICPYSEDSIDNIQKEIYNFITQQVKTADADFPHTLLLDKIKIKLNIEQCEFIVNNLEKISHLCTDYVEYYDNGKWKWQLDNEFFMQYVFEKAVELTYNVAKSNPTDGLCFELRDAFTYFQVAVSNELQAKMDGIVDKIRNVATAVNIFIMEKQYYLCNKETWFRPLVYSIALYGMQYTLEQDL